VTGRRQHLFAALEAAVAAAAMALAGVCGAHAQSASEGIGGRPWPAAGVQPVELRRLPPPDEEAAIDLPAPGKQARISAENEDDDAGMTEAATDPDLDSQPAKEAGEPQDLDTAAVEAEDAHDIAVERDLRPSQDIAAFGRPRAGYDPEAFSIEPEPLLDRRPGRLFRGEPFEPLGVRIGSFIVFPEVELGLADFSNVFHTSGGVQRDVALELRPAVRAISNWRVHALELRATGTASFHDEFSSEDDRAGLLEARGRLDIMRRTNIEALASWERTQEGRGSINEPAAAVERTDIDMLRGAVSFNHRFNRLSVQLRGSVADFDYAPVRLAAGSTASNDDRDYTQREAAARAGWLLKPGFSVFAEASINERDHKVAASDGLLRNSSGERHKVGVAFGNTGTILRGEASIGYGHQDFDAPGLRDIQGLIVDANIGWRLSALASLLLTVRSDVAETVVGGSGGALSRSAGAELRHAFTRRLIGSAGARVTWQDYAGLSLTEREIVTLLSLEYHISRELMLFGRYQHIEFDASDHARNYNADEFRFGVRVAR
jgi:hypothetical protein